LDSLLFLFPNLSHLVLNKPLLNPGDPEALANLSMYLSEFNNQKILTLKDVNFDNMGPFLTANVGEKITTLFFSGKSTMINIDHLASTCPNLTTLGITNSTLSMESNSSSSRYL
jgi:hypothetical protein